MTQTTRSIRPIVALGAAGMAALGAVSYGISTSPGATRGAGFTTSPGTRYSVVAEPEAVRLLARKAGATQQEYDASPPPPPPSR